MSLLILSMEYLLLHTIFETIRDSNIEQLKQKSLDKEKRNEILNSWNPLSGDEWKNIKKLSTQSTQNGGYI